MKAHDERYVVIDLGYGIVRGVFGHHMGIDCENSCTSHDTFFALVE